MRPWVLSPSERAAHLDTVRECPLCDRAVLPQRVHFVNRSPVWDEDSLPVALLRGHRLGEGTWGLVSVTKGRLRYLSADPTVDITVGAGNVHAIPPTVEHTVEPRGAVRFRVDYFAVEPYRAVSGEAREVSASDQGGETACLAHLVCTECGAVLDGRAHRDSCSHAG
jgi:tellurite methyltransferase